MLVDELVKPLRALVGAAGPLAEALDMGVVLFLAVVFCEGAAAAEPFDASSFSFCAISALVNTLC